MGINNDDYIEVLTIKVGETESAKYRLSVLNGLKNRGVKDILIIYEDGLTSIKRDNIGFLSKNIITALYCSSGKKYHEVCI